MDNNVLTDVQLEKDDLDDASDGQDNNDSNQ